MPQAIKPARLQSPGTAERVPSLQETLIRQESERQAAAARKSASTEPPAKKGLLQTLRERWKPVTDRAQRRR